jgi:hypothetical protein
MELAADYTDFTEKSSDKKLLVGRHNNGHGISHRLHRKNQREKVVGLMPIDIGNNNGHGNHLPISISLSICNKAICN